MKRGFLLVITLLFIGFGINAQVSDFLQRSQVHGSFEFDGAYYMPDEAIGIYDTVIDGRNFGFNAFGNIIYSLGKFSAGIRYEAYLPPLAGFDSRLEGQGIPYMWAMYTHEKFSITIGNFYEQFGNGLTLRSYEEWSLGYDNSLNGARVTYEPVKGLLFKGVYGVQRFFWEKYFLNNRGIVKGFDAELDFNRVFGGMANSKVRLILGGSVVSKYQDYYKSDLKTPRNVSDVGGRLTFGVGKVIINTEYAYKINDPSAINNNIYKEGQGFLINASYSTKGFGFFGMFKRYDNMSYRSDPAETANALDINFLPPNSEIHTYMLTGMFPYATQPNGEIGFQLQVNYKIPKKSKVGGKYGIGIAVNYSQVNDIVRDSVSYLNEDSVMVTGIGDRGSLGWTSPFFAFGDRIFWQDFNIEIDKKFSRKLKGTYKYMYQAYDIATLEGHAGEPTIYANIGLLDMTYKFTSKQALRWELQGMWKGQIPDSLITEDNKENNGNWVAALIEYTVSPHWSISIWDQWNYGNPDEAHRVHYYNFMFAYTRKTTRISIAYGRQRQGVLCVGGVCRVVPKSNGFRVTITSNF